MILKEEESDSVFFENDLKRVSTSPYSMYRDRKFLMMFPVTFREVDILICDNLREEVKCI